MIWYHTGGYFQVIFYDHSQLCVGKKTEHGEYAGPKIRSWYVIEQIFDIEGIYLDCMKSTVYLGVEVDGKFKIWFLDSVDIFAFHLVHCYQRF